MNNLIKGSPMLLAAVLLPTALHAGEFDPSTYRQQVENPTKVVVLGTARLSNADEGWGLKVLDLLLDRLAAFAPDVITIENKPGPTAYKLWACRATMRGTAATYAGQALQMAAMAGLSLDMDMPQAEAALRETLIIPGKNATPGILPRGSSRRRLLNQSTHSSVAYSPASNERHGPRRWMTAGL